MPVGLSLWEACMCKRSSALFVKRTGEDGIDAHVRLGEVRDDPLLNADKAVRAIAAAPDGGLICDDDGCETGPIGPRYRVGRAGNHAHVLGTTAIIGRLYGNPVAVEKQRPPARHGSAEKISNHWPKPLASHASMCLDSNEAYVATHTFTSDSEAQP